MHSLFGNMRRFMTSIALIASLAACSVAALAQDMQPKLEMDWNKILIVSKSTPTLQVVTNPMLNPGAPIHDSSFAALKALGADYVRYVPWLPYPKIAVAELDAPTKDKTSWDFTYIDPVTKNFLAATEGHSTIVNFSTIPAWMFKTEKPVTYPADPNQVVWNYTQGTELRDPSGKEVGDYFGRLVSWYVNGGFTDENGKRHESGYHYKLPYWEVLNEIEAEHSTTPEDYTRRYDAIVEGIHKVSPETKFVGLALAQAGGNPKYYEYFLDPKNHKPGIPLDFISFHFYAVPALDETLDGWQHTFFDQADGFLASTRFILSIRDRLSPQTKVDTDELGVILPTDGLEIMASKALPDHIPHLYWNAAGALYGYLFAELSKQGVDVIGESQLVGYPSQFPSVSMIDYNNGKPNARFWVLKLIKDNFHPGDKLVANPEHLFGKVDLEIQGFITPQGKKVLLVNKTNFEKTVKLTPDFQNATTLTVDEATGDDEPRAGKVDGTELRLAPFAVTVLQAVNANMKAVSNEEIPLKRYAFILHLRPGTAEAYEAAHRAVWPEMLALLKNAGVHEYSIYRRDDLLVLTLRATDFDATWSRIENDPVNLRWQQTMAPFFAPQEGLRPGERYPMMKEVFYLP